MEPDTEAVYPIVADPTVTFGWAIYYNYSKSETADYAAIASSLTLASRLCKAMPGKPVSNQVCRAGVKLVAGSLSNTFDSAVSQGKCVQISMPYAAFIPVTWAAQLRWKVVTC